MWVGAIQVLWSVLPIIGADLRLHRVLEYYEQAEEWFTVMASLGILLLASSILRWRGGRQLGLVLSCAMWAAFSVMYAYYLIAVKWTIGSVLMTAPLLAVFCFVLYINDVAQKPKSKGAYDDCA